MKSTTSNNNFWLTILLIIAAVIFRILSNQFNLFNFTPVIAIALFAGAKFKNSKVAVFVPLLILFITDAILAYLNNFDLFHNTILFTYGSLLLIIVLGRWLNSDKINIGKTIGFSLLSSLLFFVITNFGTWLFSNMYTLDIQGLIKCFVLAIPFNKFSWLTDLFFVIVLFGLYERISVKSADLAWQKSDTLD